VTDADKWRIKIVAGMCAILFVAGFVVEYRNLHDQLEYCEYVRGLE